MASGGVTALISKVSCESLGIRNPSLLDEALKEVEGLVEAFVDGSGPRKLVVHHHQELVEKESGERKRSAASESGGKKRRGVRKRSEKSRSGLSKSFEKPRTCRRGERRNVVRQREQSRRS